MLVNLMNSLLYDYMLKHIINMNYSDQTQKLIQSNSKRYFSNGNFKLKCELCPFETFDNEDGLIGILFHLALKHEVN